MKILFRYFNRSPEVISSRLTTVIDSSALLISFAWKGAMAELSHLRTNIRHPPITPNTLKPEPRPRIRTSVYKAAIHSQLDQMKEVRAAIAEALKLDSELTVQSQHEWRLALGLAPENAAHLSDALRKAGLPE